MRTHREQAIEKVQGPIYGIPLRYTNLSTIDYIHTILDLSNDIKEWKDVAFYLTARIKDISADSITLMDYRDEITLLCGKDLKDEAKALFGLLRIHDLVQVRVLVYQGADDTQPTKSVEDIVVVAAARIPTETPSIINTANTYDLITNQQHIRRTVFKSKVLRDIRGYLYQHGCVEVPHSDNLLLPLAQGVPTVFSTDGSTLHLLSAGRTPEDLKNFLQYVLNNVQVQNNLIDDKRFFPLDVPVVSIEQLPTEEKYYWLTGVHITNSDVARNTDGSADMMVLKKNRHSYNFGHVARGINDPEHERVIEPWQVRYTNIGCPPFSEMKFKLALFTTLLLESPHLVL